MAFGFARSSHVVYNNIGGSDNRKAPNYLCRPSECNSRQLGGDGMGTTWHVPYNDGQVKE